MTQAKKFAVVLSGCGVYDGSEIHEATLTLLAIAKLGASYTIFAPNIEQRHVVNHLTGEEMKERRNVLIESARIARGNIQDLKSYNAADFDAIVFPGGFGAAKNLSSFAFDGPACSVNEDVVQAVKSTVMAEKPIGALCIAPAVITKILGKVDVTIGNDSGTSSAIEAMGGKHVQTSHGEIVIDRNFKVVSTPCYMLEATIDQIEIGAKNVIKTIMAMI